MEQPDNNHFGITFDLAGKALSQDEISQAKKRLKVKSKSNLSFIIAVVVLGAAVSYRAITLSYDEELELFHISLYIGMWFGVFTGLMIDGSIKRKLKMVMVAVITSSSASLFLSMLAVLMMGHATVWISSITILASALACMWVLTRYDEVLKARESITTVNEKQFRFIRKASAKFKELYQFSEKIIAEDRAPLVGEYWAYRDWIRNKIDQNHQAKH